MPILENIQKYLKISNNLDYRRQISKIASKNQEHFSKIYLSVRLVVWRLAIRPSVSRPPVRELEKVQNFWYNIYIKNEGKGKLMVDYEMLSPAEQETAIRREYADSQKKIIGL